MRIEWSILAAASCLASLSAVTRADTVAYWRFEDKNGSPAAAGDFLRSTPQGGGMESGGNIVDITTDSSGNGNAMRTFHSPNVPDSPDGVERLETSPTYTLSTPGPVIPQTLAANLLAFDFDGAPGSGAPAPADAGGDDIYSLDADNVAGPINALSLSQYTIEGAFRVDTLGLFQSIMVKDGSVGSGSGVGPGPLPVFSVKLFNDNTLNIETFDGSGAFHGLAADAPVAADVWYKYAVVNDGAALRLYLDSGAGYMLQSMIGIIGFGGGALYQTDDQWAIGRGWFSGPADYLDGQVDEVRISNVALDPSQFLFTAIPEPQTAGLLLIAAASFMRRARTRALSRDSRPWLHDLAPPGPVAPAR